MKILLVHNFYGTTAPSGENEVYNNELHLLEEAQCSLEQFTVHNDELISLGAFGSMLGAVSAVWNVGAYNCLKRVIRRFRPDVMHVHNTFPRLSPSVFWAAHREKIPSVWTVHNYRIACAAGVPARAGSACSLCFSGGQWNAVRHACYRNSSVATLAPAAMIAFHRGIRTWHQTIDAFIALTEYQKDVLVRLGLPSRSIYVKPNYYRNAPAPIPWEARDNRAIFAGRLADYKGITTLVRAWEMWDGAPQLDIIGAGPLFNTISQRAYSLSSVSVLGYQSFEETQKAISRARLVIVPSECTEGFPMVIREAFALGTPVLASDLQPLPSIVHDGRTGRLFKSGDSEALRSTAAEMWGKPEYLRVMGEAARAEYEKLYTPSASLAALTGIYEKVILERQRS